MLLWLYSYKPYVKPFSGTHRKISFVYAPPVGKIRLIVRNNQGSDVFIFSEVFEHNFYDLPLPFQPSTILDLGAYVGFTAVYFARRYPKARIACVEPVAGSAKVLRLNLELNAVNAAVFPAAVAVEDGRVQMEMAPLDYDHRIAGIGSAESEARDTIQVDAISVPTLLERLGWERISLLKVDIEGYERVLLKERCEWLSRVDSMCVECHRGFGEPDLQAIAATWGFNSPVRLPGIWLLVRDRRC